MCLIYNLAISTIIPSTFKIVRLKHKGLHNLSPVSEVWKLNLNCNYELALIWEVSLLLPRIRWLGLCNLKWQLYSLNRRFSNRLEGFWILYSVCCMCPCVGVHAHMKEEKKRTILKCLVHWRNNMHCFLIMWRCNLINLFLLELLHY